jgi:ketosteroid isomerase-like protein
MSNRDTIERYVRAIQQHDYAQVIACFAANATVIHPIFGTQPATEFFRSLLAKVTADTITLKAIFCSADDPHVAAVLFSDMWTTAEGLEFKNDIVLIFNFDDAALVERLTVIFDTFPMRGKL